MMYLTTFQPVIVLLLVAATAASLVMTGRTFQRRNDYRKSLAYAMGQGLAGKYDWTWTIWAILTVELYAITIMMAYYV